MRETVLAMLRHHPFVAEFEPQHVEKLATLAKEIRFEHDQILFREGDDCSEFYLIVTGLVALEIAVPGHTFRVQTLFAGDELAGFITAVSLVKPSRSVHEVDTRSVRKKMKDKAFARSVSREDIVNGAQDLGIELDQHIDFCIRAMQGQAKELGLAGTGAPQITTM